MPNLFGIDIAGEIAKGFAASGGLVAGTLIKYTDGVPTGNLTDRPTKTPVNSTFQGFLEMGERKIVDQVTTVGDF